MAAFETTSVVTSRADQSNIVQRFLSTSERFLFTPPVAGLVHLRARTQPLGVRHDGDGFLAPALRGIQPGTPARVAT